MNKIAIYSGNKPLDRIIERLSSSEFSHVAILLNDGETVLESYPPQGCRVGSITSGFKGGQVSIYSFNDRIPAAMLEAFEQAVDKLVAEIKAGKHIPYDYFGVGAFLTKRLHQNPDAEFCSEMIALIWEGLAYPLFGVQAHLTTPADFSKLAVLKFEESRKL